MQAWINSDDSKNVAALVATLEKAAKENASKRLKAFVVFINPAKESAEIMEKRLAKLATSEKVEIVALTYLPGPSDEAVSAYRINTDPKVKNTIFVYKNRTVDTKFVNFTADAKGLQELHSAIKKILQ